MRLLITLFMLAIAQLFFNVAHASPQAPVKASQHKVDKKAARDDDRRKRRTVKTTSKKTRTASVEKNKVKKKSKPAAVAASVKKSRASVKTTSVKTASVKKSSLKKSSSKKGSQRYGRQRGDKKTAAARRGPLEMSKAHRERYQKARETAMNKLMSQLGKPYLWGGTSPHTGFDCSGLVWYAYKDVVKFKIPRTANEMYHLRDAAPINREALEKGDLVFFRINNRGAADHVGVYLGNGRFIQSPRTGKDIQISQLSDDYWQRHYVGARRVMTPRTIR
ncbi:C40 family peptidase [Pantoea alhagi]|uniref:C40 family peptidase n=1 Tax=Pantoea alhagi TaxID=1891675 RepID=UPI00202B472C|nr:C40 family peptidase [Pantoea alhagi]URQ62414.1 C40 family peptidase [Pantoea alhagi]